MPAPSLKDLIQKNNIPGASLAAVSSDGDVTVHTAGVTNRNTNQTVTNETIFEAASLSKPVFAYIVLKMVERGELDLDQKLYKNFTFGPDWDSIRRPLEFPNNYKNLTPKILLSHQAGLANEFDEEKPKTQEYQSEVGTMFDYSGEAYRFLMSVIDQINPASSDKKLPPLEILAKREFAKIGMTNSSFMPPQTDNLAVGHKANGTVDTNPHFHWIHPAASLYTTAEDYGRFLTACLNDPFIKKHMFKPMLKDSLAKKDSIAIEKGVSDFILQQLNWGLGIGLQQNDDGSLVAFHWGDNQTCRNFTAINLSTNEAAVLFTNSRNGPTIFKEAIEPLIHCDLSPTLSWLFTREEYNLQENITLNYKNKLDDLIDESEQFEDNKAPKI